MAENNNIQMQQQNMYNLWILTRSANHSGFVFNPNSETGNLFQNPETKQEFHSFEEAEQAGIIPPNRHLLDSVPHFSSDEEGRKISAEQQDKADRDIQQTRENLKTVLEKLGAQQTIFNATVANDYISGVENGQYVLTSIDDSSKMTLSEGIQEGKISGSLDDIWETKAEAARMIAANVISPKEIREMTTEARQAGQKAAYAALDCNRAYAKEMAVCAKTLMQNSPDEPIAQEPNGVYDYNAIQETLAHSELKSDMKDEMTKRLQNVKVVPSVTLAASEVKVINDSAQPINEKELTREGEKQYVDIKVHRYNKEAYEHARRRIHTWTSGKRPVVSSEQIDRMRKNIQQLEQEGRLEMGVDKDGKPCSNSDIYIYKLLASKKLYSPNEPVVELKELPNGYFKKTNKKIGTVEELVDGNFRKTIKSLGKEKIEESDKEALVKNIRGTEKAVSAEGYAILGVNVKKRFSYNINKNPGFEEETLKIEAPVSQQSSEKPASEQEKPEQNAGEQGVNKVLKGASEKPVSEQEKPDQKTGEQGVNKALKGASEKPASEQEKSDQNVSEQSVDKALGKVSTSVDKEEELPSGNNENRAPSKKGKENA